MRASSLESATMQLRMSPGGSMRFSRRRRPELPPSSVTVTMAARSVMGRSLVRASDVFFEAAEERREAGAAAESDDFQAARDCCFSGLRWFQVRLGNRFWRFDTASAAKAGLV